jgi:putative acetyltransferase
MESEIISAPRAMPYPREPANARHDWAPQGVIGVSSGVVLRYARDEDAPAIIALIAGVWAEYPGKTLVAAADMPELLRPASAYAGCDGLFWVVEAAGEIVGTIALQPSAEPGVVELQKLYVAREMRRNGLGAFLCQLVEREARRRGAHAIELWTDIKLLDAHRRYERLGYMRGEALKTYNDTSGTVRFYYRKALDRELPDHPDYSPEANDRWQVLLYPGATTGASPRDGVVMKALSFTEHPASVGETYLQHLRQAAGFSASMILGGLAVFVHAVLPFLFTRTGAGVISDLNTRMITNRRRPLGENNNVGRPAAPPVARTDSKRASAA